MWANFLHFVDVSTKTAEPISKILKILEPLTKLIAFFASRDFSSESTENFKKSSTDLKNLITIKFNN